MIEDITYNSYDLLSFDFLHDNKGQVDFFNNNKVYNLNYLAKLPNVNYLENFNEDVKFNINDEYYKNNIPSNVEDYVKNIMFTNFINQTEHYVNTNDTIPIEYEKNYILIFDNMQCSLNNILNVKMLLNNPKIEIYIPFIACCEKINPRCKSNSEITTKCINIKNAHNSLAENLFKTNELEKNNIEIFKCDFYDNRGELKQEYKDESILIGFNYINNKLLNFNDINDLPCEIIIDKNKDSEKIIEIKEKQILANKITINKIIKIFNEFKEFTKIIEINNKLYYDNVIKNLLDDIKHLENTNYIYNKYDDNNKINIQKFNNVKALIYSMKEMRDWYYIKEIIKRQKDLFDYKTIFCTVDTINLFRSIIYRISTFNLSHYNIKYITMHVNKDNKEYIYYKQISPSYFYLNNNDISNQTKQKIFNLLNNNDTFFVKKEIKTITGGNVKYLNSKSTLKNNSLTNIKIKKYSIYSMDTVKLRLEISTLIGHLRNNICCINISSYDTTNHYNDIKHLKYINKLYISIQKLYEFTNKYNYDDLIKINYKYKTIKEFNNSLSSSEMNFIKLFYNGDIECYSKELENFNRRIIKDYAYKINKLKTNKFYADENYILTEQEQLSSLILTFIIESEINIRYRENFGYALKTILNEYDYNLIRNVLSVFYDGLEYNDFIRGKRELMEIFDEDLFYEVTKIVTNPYYDLSNDKIKIEEFEQKHESKYNEIQELIKINKLIN